MKKIKTTVNGSESLSEFEASDIDKFKSTAGRKLELKGSFIADNVNLDLRPLLSANKKYSPSIELIQDACDTARRMHNSSTAEELEDGVGSYYDRWTGVNNVDTIVWVYKQILPDITNAKLSVTSKHPGMAVYLVKVEWNVLRGKMPIVVGNYKDKGISE